MIPILLRDLRWRLLLIALLSLVFYRLEPAFHAHELVAPQEAVEFGPLGVSATLAFLSAASVIVLLAGFVSGDRREGYHRIFFSHPTSPLAWYGLRWGLGVLLSLTAATVFLLLGQWVAWGEVRGGGSGMLLALLFALVYGSLMAFFSTALPRGETWIVALLFLTHFFWPYLSPLTNALDPALLGLLDLVLPPREALRIVRDGILASEIAWGAVGYIAGYSAVWLTAAILLIRLREWS